VKLNNITENGIYGECIDYPEYNIFLPPTEINRRKVNLQKFFSPDKKYAMVVLSINVESKLMDVSYTKINEKDREIAIKKFENYERIYNLGKEIIQLFMDNSDITINDYNNIFNEIIHKNIEQIESTFDTDTVGNNIEKINDTYISFLENPELLFVCLKESLYYINLDQQQKDLIDDLIVKYITNLRKRLYISDVIVACDINLVVLVSDAVTQIKNILTENLDIGDDENIVSIEYVSSPKYRIVITSKRKTNGLLLLDKISDILEENSQKYHGNLTNLRKYNVVKEKQYSLSSYIRS
jgi:translation initiation factor 2 alpha subunit (eIF-2alpha)